MKWQKAVEYLAMRGLIIDALCLMLYVERPLPFENASIIIIISSSSIRTTIYTKYAGEQFSPVIT